MRISFYSIYIRHPFAAGLFASGTVSLEHKQAACTPGVFFDPMCVVLFLYFLSQQY